MMASPDGTAKAVDGQADLANGHEEDHVKPKIHIEDPEELDDTKPIDGAETATPATTPVPAKDGAIAPQPQQERVMELQELALKVFYAWLGLLVLSVLVLWLWSWELIRSLAFGLVLGLGASLLHRWNIKRKVRMAQVVRGVVLGLGGDWIWGEGLCLWAWYRWTPVFMGTSLVSLCTRSHSGQSREARADMPA